MRVTVILTDEEYGEVKKRAGLIPLSAWFRSVALEQAGALPIPKKTVIAVREVMAKGSKVDAVAEIQFDGSYKTGGDEIRLPKCPHHKLRGELCYKCDDKFGMPKVEV